MKVALNSNSLSAVKLQTVLRVIAVVQNVNGVTGFHESAECLTEPTSSLTSLFNYDAMVKEGAVCVVRGT